MALIQVGKDTFKDTDDLEQAEYHYFRKAESMGRTGVAKRILLGYLDAEEIDTNPEYEWLCDPDTQERRYHAVFKDTDRCVFHDEARHALEEGISDTSNRCLVASHRAD